MYAVSIHWRFAVEMWSDRWADGNAMIASSSGTSCGSATGDWSGTNFDAANLTNAGWGAGKTVTMDGASFTVPSGYVDYVDLTGAKTATSGGLSITISVLPITLEQ